MFRFLTQLISPPHRRRGLRVERVCETAALESRTLLAAIQVGPVLFQSEAIGIDDVRGAVVKDGQIHVVGNDVGLGVRQLVTIASGEVSAMETFTSIAGVSGRNPNTELFGVSLLADDRIIYLGSSANGPLNAAPTYWFNLDSPNAAASFATDGGALLVATLSGLLAGRLNISSAVGTLSQPLQPLPAAEGGSDVLDATSDDVYLVGSGGIHHLVTSGTLNYEKVNLSEIVSPGDALELPSAWRDVEVYGSQQYAAFGNYLTTSFSSNVLGIDPVTMATVFQGQEGDTLVDARTYSGVLIVMVQGPSGPAIYSSADGFTARTELAPLFGGVSVQAVVNTMNDMGLGFIAQVNGTTRAVSLELTVTPDALLVDSAIHQGNYAANVVSTKVATFEVGLKGSSTFDVSKIDRTSLFVGDDRNTATGKVISVRFTDTNKDGVKDAIIKVQTSTALRTNTTRLRITGRTTTGQDFDASRNVTSTSQTWIAHWQATSGPTWVSAYITYLLGKKRTWW